MNGSISKTPYPTLYSTAKQSFFYPIKKSHYVASLIPALERAWSARAFLHTRSRPFVWIPPTSSAFGENTTVLQSNSLPNKISLILFIYFSYLFFFSSYLLVSFYIYYSQLFLFYNISECSMFLVLSTALKHPKRRAILRFKMDEGCFELKSHRLVFFVLC